MQTHIHGLMESTELDNKVFKKHYSALPPSIVLATKIQRLTAIYCQQELEMAFM